MNERREFSIAETPDSLVAVGLALAAIKYCGKWVAYEALAAISAVVSGSLVWWRLAFASHRASTVSKCPSIEAVHGVVGCIDGSSGVPMLTGI